jgi:hypothetical protein
MCPLRALKGLCSRVFDLGQNNFLATRGIKFQEFFWDEKAKYKNYKKLY